MTLLRAWIRRARALLHRRRADTEMDEELRFHLEMETDKYMRAGMSRDEARRRARLAFGGVERFREEVRETRGLPWLETLAADLRYAVRTLWKNPVFALVSVLTLALGIGANTAIFSYVDRILLRPVAYPALDRLVAIYTRFAPESGYDFPFFALSAPELHDFRTQTRTVRDVAGFTFAALNLSGGDAAPDRVRAVQATANVFATLGVRPSLGRAFLPGEDAPGKPCVTVLSHGLWRERFAGAAAVVGRVVRLDGRPCEVVGVMPRDFVFPVRSVRLWMPLAIDPTPSEDDRGNHGLFAIGRLDGSSTLADAEAELGPMMGTWRRELDHYRGHFIVLRPFRSALVSDVHTLLLVLFGAVGVVLLIVIANLTSLLLARTQARRREIAVRVALGAGRRRLVGQFVTESLMLSIASGALGVLVAMLFVRGLQMVEPESISTIADVSLSGPALAFNLALTLIAGAAMGLVPALQALPSSLDSELRATSHASTSSGMARTRKWLVAGELALSVALVAAAGLLLRSHAELQQVPLGFGSDRVLAVNLTLPEGAYGDPARTITFYGALREQLAARPGVTSVGLVSALPLRAWPAPDDIRIEGRPDPAPGEQGYNAGFYMISPGFRETMQIPLLGGRDLDERDVLGAQRAALVNAAAVRAFWPGENPVGRRIRYYGADSGWITVVGVVGDTRYRQVDEAPRPAVYTAHAQLPRGQSSPGLAMTLVARAERAPETLMPAIREIVGTLDPEVPLASVATMDDVIATALGGTRFASVLMAFFAGAALLLGALGIYGVVAFMVQHRTREIGIRIALGAKPWQVRKLVMGEGVHLLLIGAGVGLLLTLALGRALSSLLYGISAIDPVTLVAVVLVLTMVVLLASYLPARRATRVDPLIAVRAE